MAMEVDTETLNEPRPTQLDVHLRTGRYHVAVECKFCESGFGTCSRVRSRGTETPPCDGTYSHQKGRRTRCALSEIGVSYWNVVPAIFDLDAARDMFPCPLLPTYQIVRNVLAALVDENGRVDPERGHAVFVYDGRNPAFKPGGVADRQLRDASAACKLPGAIRRVTWQEVVRACSRDAALAWLAQAMEQKHGIYAES